MAERLAFTFHTSDGVLTKGTRRSKNTDKALKAEYDEIPEHAYEKFEEEEAPAQEATPPETAETESPSGEDESGGDGEPTQPAKNASTEEWAAYAEQVGVEVDEDAGRDDIIATLSDRGLVS